MAASPVRPVLKRNPDSHSMKPPAKPKFRSAIGIALLWGLALSAIVGMSLFLQAPSIQAQAGDIPCDPKSYPLKESRLLAEQTVTSTTTILPHVYYTSPMTTVIYSGAEIICLASSEDGRGELKVDDELRLYFVRSDTSVDSQPAWQHDFFNLATGGISETPAQDISRFFSLGENRIIITFTDLRPPEFSATEVWLVVWSGSVPTPSQTPTSIVAPSRVLSPSPVPTIRATATPTPGNIPNNTILRSRVRVLIGRAVSWIGTASDKIDENGWWPIVFLVVLAILIGLFYFLYRLMNMNLRDAHAFAILAIRREKKRGISKMRSVRDTAEALRMFDNELTSLINTRKPLVEDTAAFVREHLEALYESLTKE